MFWVSYGKGLLGWEALMHSGVWCVQPSVGRRGAPEILGDRSPWVGLCHAFGSAARNRYMRAADSTNQGAMNGTSENS